MAGGLVPGDRTTGRAIVVDLRTGHARPLPSLSVPVHDTAAGLVAGRPTVVGGGNTSEQAVVQSMTAGRWHHLASLPTTRSDLAIAEWHRDAYVIGGYDGSSEPRTVLRLTPHGSPRPVGALKRGVRYAATARIGSQVYVIGGEQAGQELDTIQNVDLATGRTRPAGHLAVPIGHAMAAPVGHRILVMGGRTTPTHQTDAMWWYDPKTGRVHSAGRLPRPLSDAAVTYHRRRIWLLGGEHPAITDRVVIVTVR
jgi:N-acetylneuraminic acid mutarotase